MLDIYVRLHIDDLRELRTSHLYSELENGLELDEPDAALLRGFTEWSAPAERVLSFGWDWSFDPEAGVMLGEWASLRTNLMVIDDAGLDMGQDCTRLCVARLMTRARWERAVATSLALPLRMPPES